MMLDFLFLMLVVKYRDELVNLFESEDIEVENYAGLDYQPKRHLRLVIDQ